MASCIITQKNITLLSKVDFHRVSRIPTLVSRNRANLKRTGSLIDLEYLKCKVFKYINKHTRKLFLFIFSGEQNPF